MREIKFRARDSVTNEWRYGQYLIEYGYQPYPIKAKNSPPRIDDNIYCITFPGFADWGMRRETLRVAINPETLGEYTGLKGKNGVEIYEGDILGGSWGCYIGYCDICKSFQVMHPVWGDNPCAACDGDVHWYEAVQDDSIEVIGNIYENPELIDGQS